MTRTSSIRGLAVMLCAGPLLAQSAGSGVVPDAEIRRILVERVDTHRQAVGIVVGVIESSGRRVIAYGRAAQGDSRPLDGDTIFEIGSISKLFTSLLLTDAVARGEVALTDPIAKYLPQGAVVPERGRPITLQDLGMHTSGLPRLPDNMPMKDGSNPYADYTVDHLNQFLATYRLPRDVGALYEYSNVGVGLLGHLLTRRTGMDYETLVKTRIAGPLGMSSTTITLTPAMQARLAAGHDGSLQRAKNWDVPSLAGAGALRSTTNDMLTFLAAVLGYTDSPLEPAMAAMLQTRRPTGGPGTDVALAWHVTAANGGTLVWHNGGYRTFIGFNPDARTGVVVLANAATLAGPDDIGRHLLDPKAPLLAASSPLLAQPKVRTEVTVDPKAFDRFVGRYQFAPGVLLTVARDGSRFTAQLTGQQAFEIFAESEKDYFLKVVDAQLTFETNDQNTTTSVVLHQNGRDQRAARID